MKARIVSLITASLLTASMNSAIACLPPPPTLSRLEGESDDAYARRLEPFEAERVRRDQEEVDRFSGKETRRIGPRQIASYWRKP
ncbi:hypothetical protein ACFSUK_14735 [Sphingobium scionense]|uniref:Uncharacterized protein n=1 Tax=Sphingobium scionense TaxID=1404341 RepID=A0A7W6LU16_9SPHN|nr:hypothetical protein [Sphingobium scionense]MBB4149366.1 hypothetical protein [Sphingobium scionense]